MLRVAGFAKSQVESTENINDESEESMNEEVQKFDYEVPDFHTNPPKEEYSYDDIAADSIEFAAADAGNNFYGQACGEIDERLFQNTLGLPSGFSVGHVEKQIKGNKQTFYCDICLVELSSLDTMKSHVAGVKHQKKEMTVKKEWEEKVLRGEITEEEAKSQMPRVKPIANPESVKKKIPVRLHERVRDSKDPVVGLSYVTEYLPESDPEMEPFYECSLCGNQGQANGMFSHVMGGNHRKQFMAMVVKHGSSNPTRSQLLRIANKYSENDKKLSILIKTIQSDLEYPWPPSKAPWAVERGGSGVPPVGARGHTGSGRDKRRDMKEVSKVTRNCKLPAPSSVGPPSSDQEAQRMIEVGKRLVEMAMEFSGSGIGQEEAQIIQTTLDKLLGDAQKNLGDYSESKGL